MLTRSERFQISGVSTLQRRADDGLRVGCLRTPCTRASQMKGSGTSKIEGARMARSLCSSVSISELPRWALRILACLNFITLLVLVLKILHTCPTMIRHRPLKEVLEDLRFSLEVLEERSHCGLDLQHAAVLRSRLLGQIARVEAQIARESGASVSPVPGIPE
jgi:hypothetical protein